MKKTFLLVAGIFACTLCFSQTAKNSASTGKKLFLDVHEMGPNGVSFDDVMTAHQKDLKVGPKYGVNFEKFWVDETNGKVYCLASASSGEDLVKAHKKAHGLVPRNVYEVSADVEAAAQGNQSYFLDVHNVGAGHVTKEAVAGAHKKDLAVQSKYGVNLINYWLDEKNGLIFCLAQAPDSAALSNTHKEAHGLLPNSVNKVKQGQ